MTGGFAVEISLLALMIALLIYCYRISHQIKKMNDLEIGLGGAIAVMSSELDRLECTINNIRSEAISATSELTNEIERAKQERAFWVLQQKFSEAPNIKTRRTRRRRLPMETFSA